EVDPRSHDLRTTNAAPFYLCAPANRSGARRRPVASRRLLEATAIASRRGDPRSARPRAAEGSAAASAVLGPEHRQDRGRLGEGVRAHPPGRAQNVVFRGEAAKWRDAKTKVECLDTIACDGYRIKKLRYEI